MAATVGVPSSLHGAAAGVKEVTVENLTNTGVSILDASARLYWLNVDNSQSSADVYVKLFDKATAPDHAAEDTNHHAKIKAGASGTIRAMGWSLFGSGLGAAASTSAALDGSAPTVPPTIKVGFSSA